MKKKFNGRGNSVCNRIRDKVQKNGHKSIEIKCATLYNITPIYAGLCSHFDVADYTQLNSLTGNALQVLRKREFIHKVRAYSNRNRERKKMKMVQTKQFEKIATCKISLRPNRAQNYQSSYDKTKTNQ